MSEEIVKIATVESRDASKEAQKLIDLAELQQRRRDIQAALDSEMSRIAEALSTRVPESARKFVQNELRCLTTFVETLSRRGSFGQPITHELYGDRAVEIMNELKNAWSGIVDVEIVTRQGMRIGIWFANMNFKIPEKNVGGITAQD